VNKVLTLKVPTVKKVEIRTSLPAIFMLKTFLKAGCLIVYARKVGFFLI